jgi:hypothetical protein
MAGWDKDVISLPLGGWQPVARDLYAVYPASRQLNPKVRALIDYVVSGGSWVTRVLPACGHRENAAEFQGASGAELPPVCLSDTAKRRCLRRASDRQRSGMAWPATISARWHMLTG